MKPAHRCLRSSVLFLLLLTLAALPALAGVDRFTPFGPMNGRFRALVVDPHSPASLLAAPSLTGVYRSDDGGHAWAWSGAGLGQEAIQALAADPANPGTFYALATTQAFRSNDSGRHWVAVASGQRFDPNFVFDSTGPRYAALVLLSAGTGALPTLLVGNAQYLQRSADGGATWSTVFTVDIPLFASDSIWSLAVDPTTPTPPRRVFAGFATGSGGNLLESADGGQTWAPLPNLPNPSHGILALLALPTSPVTLLASTTGDSSAAELFKSTDLGATWVEVPLSSSSPLSVTALAYEPQTPSIVYAAASRNLFVSADAGNSWAPRGAGLTDFGINALVPAPGTRTVYALSGNDLEKSLDRGRHWSIAAQSGFDFSAPFQKPALALRFSPDDPAHVYAILDGQGFESTNGGATWTSFATDRAPLYNQRPWDLQIDPANPDILYVLTNTILFRSTDRGATWAIWSTPPGAGEGFMHLLLLGRKPALVADFGIARSRDGGRTWTRAVFCGSSTQGDFEGRRIDRLLFDPRQPSVVYAGLTDTFGRHPAMPFPETCKSLDGGATWKQLIPDSAALALDPSRVGRLYVSRPAGFQRSDDGGRTFHTLSSFGAAPFVVTGTYVSDLLVDPVTPTTLYAATRDRGVWRSLDAGVTWEAVNAGLARTTDLQTYQLVLHPTVPHLLYAEVDGWLFQNGFTEP